MRIGAGLKGKIVTSLGHGLPVITTSIGDQGLGMAERIGVPVCDDPEEFACSLLELYDDAEQWRTFSARTRALAKEMFGRERARAIIDEAVQIAVQRCTVCGGDAHYAPTPSEQNLREAIVCVGCRAAYRNVKLADAILGELGVTDRGSLAAAADILGKLDIYEISGGGAITKALADLPGYVGSKLEGSEDPGGAVTCSENVERLSFADENFDLVISEDVFEHVADPERGFREILRVLKPGGRHIFTIPFHRTRTTTVVRAKPTPSGIVHLEPEEYHYDPHSPGPSLVYTDFSWDIVDRLTGLGFEVDVVATHDPRHLGSHNEVFVTRKPCTGAVKTPTDPKA